MKPVRLAGVNVAVTGGARGIGLATARAFAAQGATVHVGDIDEGAAHAAAAEIGGKGYAVDVRSRESFAAFLAAIDGPLDVLVNNAGIMPMGRFVDEDDLITDAILDINVRGVLIGAKLALRGMLARGHGHIVNVASYLGEVPAAGLAGYCASKHAVIGFSESLRDELHGTGVTVTAVLPSAVRTDLVAGVRLGGVLPTVEPERIADAVVASCRHRRTLVAVPGWMRGYKIVAALLPDRVLAAVRGGLTRDRVLHSLDNTARSAYDARVRRDSADLQR
ncbi:SDR family oxidoreductase [Nocardia sp. NPDC058176]|uniref:SDR family oxidoreductase n=1 Tax=Nocardia sp. NPDC058176 TaxID=3346368 RepID=UPI0036DA67AD